MSKISPKQRYTQLMEWLAINKRSTTSTRKPKRMSKTDYYKRKGARQDLPGYNNCWLHLFLVFNYNDDEVGENGTTQVYIRVQTS